jgi:hypothetical protein
MGELDETNPVPMVPVEGPAGRWRRLAAGAAIGVMAVLCLIGVVVVSGRLPAQAASPSWTGACPPGATIPPPGLSEACAVEVARSRLPTPEDVISTWYGRWAESVRYSPDSTADANRVVWVVNFVSAPMCEWPPDGGPCISFGPGVAWVVLDAATGETLSSGASYGP